MNLTEIEDKIKKLSHERFILKLRINTNVLLQNEYQKLINDRFSITIELNRLIISRKRLKKIIEIENKINENTN